MLQIVKWHYIGALWAGPDDDPSGSSRRVIDAQGIVDGRLKRNDANTGTPTGPG